MALNASMQLVPLEEDRSEQLFLFHRFAEMQQWPSVIQTGKELLAADPENADVHETMCQAHLCTQQMDQALKHAEKALQLNPDSHRTLFYLSIIQSENRKHDEADKVIAKAIEMDPNNPLYWEQRAKYAYNRKRHKLAKQYISSATALAPNDADIINMTVLIDDALDEYDMTPPQVYIDRFKKALSYEPENTDCLNNIGVRYLNMKDPETAENYFRRALAIDPTIKESRDNVLSAIRHQDLLFRILYFPLDKLMMPILRFFQICWAKKWPIIFLLFIGKYLIVIGVSIFAIWCVFFYPLIYVYKWMTLIDLRRKSGDLSLRIPEFTKPFFRLSRSTRIASFIGVWALAWTAFAVSFTQAQSETFLPLLAIICAILFLSAVWVKSALKKT